MGRRLPRHRREHVRVLQQTRICSQCGQNQMRFVSPIPSSFAAARARTIITFMHDHASSHLYRHVATAKARFKLIYLHLFILCTLTSKDSSVYTCVNANPNVDTNRCERMCLRERASRARAQLPRHGSESVRVLQHRICSQRGQNQMRFVSHVTRDNPCLISSS